MEHSRRDHSENIPWNGTFQRTFSGMEHSREHSVEWNILKEIIPENIPWNGMRKEGGDPKGGHVMSHHMEEPQLPSQGYSGASL